MLDYNGRPHCKGNIFKKSLRDEVRTRKIKRIPSAKTKLGAGRVRVGNNVKGGVNKGHQDSGFYMN